METIVNILLNPFTLMISGLIIALGLLVSPYEIKFEDGDEAEN